MRCALFVPQLRLTPPSLTVALGKSGEDALKVWTSDGIRLTIESNGAPCADASSGFDVAPVSGRGKPVHRLGCSPARSPLLPLRAIDESLDEFIGCYEKKAWVEMQNRHRLDRSDAYASCTFQRHGRSTDTPLANEGGEPPGHAQSRPENWSVPVHLP